MISENANPEENLPNIPQSAPLELTTKHNIPSTSANENFGFPLPVKNPKGSKMGHDNEKSKYTYPIQMTNPFERDNWTVSTDHCYARPWNWRPEATFLRPTKTLFIPKNIPSKQNLFNLRDYGKEKPDLIDIEAFTETASPVYDVDKAKVLMGECDKHTGLSRSEDIDEDWEERILKTNWTSSQHRLFNGFVNILNGLHMAKLAQSGVSNEPILRRTVIDKAVERTRRLFATFSFDTKLAQWLHILLIDNLDFQYLSLYLDILQTLKAKLPTFVEKMLYSSNSSLRMGPLNNENLFPLLKQPWDPVAANLNQDKPKKLPSNPIIVLVPSSPVVSKKSHKWMNLLSNLGCVVTVPTNFGSAGHRMTMTNCLDQMFSLTRGRVQEMRENYHGRQIILAGFGAGATLALQVAQVESVLCVIALGFSLLTAEGRRGEPDDILLELQCPVLFVIGQCSSTSLQEDMEDLRERMRVETGLIVIGSGDNNLKISKKKKREEGVTQSIVDRCIIDEVGEFVSGLILSPFPPQIRQSPPTVPSSEIVPARKKGDRKRFNSNASSVESEPPSPVPARISRPVGRPPGKAKSKLEAKWAAQIAQGIPPPLTPIFTNSNNTSNLPESPITPDAPLSPSNNNSLTPNSNSDTSTATESPIPYLNVSPKSTSSEKVIKKIKTLKPVIAGAEKSVRVKETDTQPQARLQAYNLNRNVMVAGGQLSTLLQGGIKTIPPSTPKSSASGIKVLENVQLNNTTTAKLMSSSGKSIDLSKLTAMNPLGTGKTNSGNVVLLPDGKIKTVGATMKGTGGTPLLLPLSPSKASDRGPRGKYVTSKRQLVSPRNSRPIKRQTYTTLNTLQSNLPPPTNLTTQDIMDLPIIFADDNQIIDNTTSLPTDLSTTASHSHTNTHSIQNIPKLVSTSSTNTNKFLIVTKPSHMSSTSNFIITSSGIKRPLSVVTTSKPPAKYTKIILSKKPSEFNLQLKKSSTTVANIEAIDLESELKATAVPKPNLSLTDIRNIQNIIPKNEENISYELLEAVKNEIAKTEGDDPDYIPPKNLKM